MVHYISISSVSGPCRLKIGKYPIIMIPGNSGSMIELVGGVIRKTGGDRLVKQARKQQQFRSTARIKAPKVLRVGYSSIDMEYVGGSDFMRFVATAGKRDLSE